MSKRPERDLRNCPLFCDDDAGYLAIHENMPTLEEGDSLLSTVVGQEEDILPVTAWVPSDLERLGYFGMYYRDCARELVQVSLDRRLGAENYFYVVGFLYRHAIELYMKSIIATTPSFRSASAQEQAELTHGHDLMELWSRVKPRIEHLYSEGELLLTERLLGELHSLDEGSDAFRYPFRVAYRTTGERRTLLSGLGQVSYNNFVWVMEALCSWFVSVEGSRGLRG